MVWFCVMVLYATEVLGHFRISEALVNQLINCCLLDWNRVARSGRIQPLPDDVIQTRHLKTGELDQIIDY